MIDTQRGLEALVERALDADAVALDTEFVWERTYYPRLGVVQLGLDHDDLHLLDAAALDLAPLGRLLEDERVVKILHDAEQDLTILRRATGAYPRSIFDTQLAAGFVGLPSTLSLGDLVAEVQGIHLPKTESRTDWLRRPLSEKQRAYALDDVRYLPAVYRALLDRARQRQRMDWMREELATYDDPDRYDDPDPRRQHLRVSGAGRLTGRQRAVLRELAAWREEEARRQDRPRGHVVHDKVLGAVARRLPRTPNDLGGVRGLDDRSRRRYGEALVAAVARGLALPADEHPGRRPSLPNDDAFTARVNLALAALTGTGLAEGIDPGLVATRADVAALVEAFPEPDADGLALLQGWRRAFLGDALLALLAGRRAVLHDPDTGLVHLSERR